MDGYLNSRSMITPGIAGATTTMITGTLAAQFGLPGNYTALVVSFILGLMVLQDNSIVIYQRLMFYVVNSIVIFTMAMGINAAGVAASKSSDPITRSVPIEGQGIKPNKNPAFFRNWL